MNKRNKRSIWILLAFGLKASAPLMADEFEAGPLVGRVENAETGRPISDAVAVLTWGLKAKIRGTGKKEQGAPTRLDAKEARTDSAGRFRFHSSLNVSEPPESTVLDPTMSPRLEIVARGYQSYVGPAAIINATGRAQREQGHGAGVIVFKLEPLGSAQQSGQITQWYDALDREIRHEVWVGGAQHVFTATRQRLALLGAACGEYERAGQLVPACVKAHTEVFGLAQSSDSNPVQIMQDVLGGGDKPGQAKPRVPEYVDDGNAEPQPIVPSYLRPRPDHDATPVN